MKTNLYTYRQGCIYIHYMDTFLCFPYISLTCHVLFGSIIVPVSLMSHIVGLILSRISLTILVQDSLLVILIVIPNIILYIVSHPSINDGYDLCLHMAIHIQSMHGHFLSLIVRFLLYSICVRNHHYLLFLYAMMLVLSKFLFLLRCD